MIWISCAKKCIPNRASFGALKEISIEIMRTDVGDGKRMILSEAVVKIMLT